MITVTTQAVAQIREAASQNDAAGMALRIAARREADGSIQYGMGFDDTREGDVEIDAEGQIVLVSPVHAELLSGATLDYVELQPGDFRFISQRYRWLCAQAGRRWLWRLWRRLPLNGLARPAPERGTLNSSDSS
jgi:iron-sulfur cluster assembly protein